ncbi:MAG: molybdopterin molybdotransferase MoeA, partial [Acidobacteriota bacterium]|nr:molybdopterin molybdotransferase MoeA [Acidobacteriota bacterium]
TARPVAEALSEFRPPHRTGPETVQLGQAAGRVPVADILAGTALPGFDRSAVDGYAVHAHDTFGASESIPAYLTMAGSVAMGSPAERDLPALGAIAVPTGAALPQGADAVVMIEHTQEAMPGTIEVVRPVAPGEGVVRRDDDLTVGSTAARAGAPLLAHDIAMLAALGITRVEVHSRPRVTILATGDELVAPDAGRLAPGQVRDALSSALSALVEAAGGSSPSSRIVGDEPGLLEGALEVAARESDMVVVCAGSSVGARDQTAGAVAALPDTQIWCHGLAIKPGKPTLLATSSGMPIIGLPGNPRSALVVFRLVGMPLVRRAGGWMVEQHTPSTRRRLSRDLPSAPGRLDIVQVRLVGERAEPIFGPSALLSVLTGADGYVIVPDDANGLPAGETVEVFLYR